MKKSLVALLLGALSMAGTTPSSAAAVTNGIDYYISAPFVQGSYVTGSGVSIATFNSDATGVGQCSTVGDISFASANCEVEAAGWYGGAIVSDSTATVGTATSATNYASVESGALAVSLAQPMRYLGFYWSAGSSSDTVVFKSEGQEVLRLTTVELMAFFGASPNGIGYGSSGSVTIDGTTYPKHYYFGNPVGHPTTTPSGPSSIGASANEPFVFVHIFTNGSTTFDSLELRGSGFEFDNLTVSTRAQSPADNIHKIGSALPVVTFDSNTGEGEMAPQSSPTASTLTRNTFSKSGYVFSGWNTVADGSGVSYRDGQRLSFSSSMTLFAQWELPRESYDGPQLLQFSTRVLDACTASAVTIVGVNLIGVKASIQGNPVTVLENTDQILKIVAPAGLSAGAGFDLVLESPTGLLRHQNAFDVPFKDCSQAGTGGQWTQIQADGKTVKMYAKNPIGAGKVQFFVDGKELAWISAVDASDPKLSFASGFPYLVRSVELHSGKNRFAIFVDGIRVWRTTYVLKP